MKITFIILLFTSLLSAIGYDDIDKTITYNMWDKSSAPTNYDASYLKEVAININKLEESNLQLNEVLDKRHKTYKSYDEMEIVYNKIVKKLKVTPFFYDFEKAQIILVLQILQKDSIYGNNNTYNEKKEGIVKYLHSYTLKHRTSNAKIADYQIFLDALRAFRMTNFMLNRAFKLLPKIIIKR